MQAIERNKGLPFVVIGFAVTLLGAALATVCTPSPSGYCLPTPYSGVGVAAALMGGVLFLVGLILVLKAEGGLYRPPTPVVPAQAAMCQVCGKPLAWIPTANRWFCSKCDAYR
jgi:hypothetical protein